MGYLVPVLFICFTQEQGRLVEVNIPCKPRESMHNANQAWCLNQVCSNNLGTSLPKSPIK